MSPELEAFHEYIVVTKALSASSVEAYMSDLSLLEEELKKNVINFNNEEIFKTLGKIENKRTLNRKLSSLNAFFDFCYKSYHTQSTKFELSKIPKNLPKFLSYEHINDSLKLIDQSTIYGLRDYALILFLYATGLRVSECLSVRRDDFEGEWLRVRFGKGEKERYVPIAKPALNAIQLYLNERDSDSELIWLNYKGKTLSRISAFKITQKYLNVSPHVLRHSYATALILGGADLRVVQELLGHASLLTTQVYTHLQKQNLQETVVNYHPMSKEKI
ncbi:MAG: tyrosine-type recombinase/integrase [Helicobacteraceae bacterium]|nr:tyrosine-type recombinase/integrase [Helicobacteraceae bacterium]